MPWKLYMVKGHSCDVFSMGEYMKRSTGALLFALAAFFLSGCASVQESIYDAGISAERMLSGMDEGHVLVQGNTISYLERKGTGETIVLIHGFGADKDSWVRFTRYIPKEYRVIAFDLPGHGESFKTNDKTYTLDFIMQGFAGAAEALKLDRFHLAGNSMGGWISMLYTNRNPDKVITLGLMDTAGLISPEPSDRQKALEKGRNVLIPATDDDFFALLSYAFHKEPFLPWPAKNVYARRAVADAPLKRKIWKDIWSTNENAENLLPELKLPVIIIWGNRDRITHVSTVEVLERYLPNSKTVIFPDCGHMPMLERPEETAHAYTNYLGGYRQELSAD